MTPGSVSDGGFIQSIPQFYSGKNILITGVTGFMGKVLLEKLLRSCPQIGKIYMIIRGKKEKNRHDRLKEVTDLPLFDVLKSEQSWSEVEKKFVPMNGDISELKLGLSEEDYQTLADNVSIVFHVAASVRFDDPLTDAVRMNTRGTREIVELCLKMKSLKALLHVSSTYSNCNRRVVEERIYPPPMEWRDAIELTNKLDVSTLNILSKKYLADMPNTYTFTKALAEDLIWEYRTQLPIIILRPSIVVSSWKDPFPGWLDNINGPMGMLVGGGKGVIRTCFLDPSVVADYMPVDIAIRAMIATVWHHSVNRIQDESKLIYNCASTKKSISTQEIMELGLETVAKYPFLEVLWVPHIHFTTNKTFFYISSWVKHLLPSILLDALLRLRGRKPMFVKLHQRIFRAILELSFFTMQQWTFKNDNFTSVSSYIFPEDKKDFDTNIATMDTTEFFTNAALGARKYLLKEDISNLPEARRKSKIMHWIDRTVRISFILLVIWYLSYQSWAHILVVSIAVILFSYMF